MTTTASTNRELRGENAQSSLQREALIVANPQEGLSFWKEHFIELGRSRSDGNDVVKGAADDIPVLHATSS